MKRWEDGQYIDLAPDEERAEAARRAAAEAEEHLLMEREAARVARIETFRAKARAGRLTVDDLYDVVLALLGE